MEYAAAVDAEDVTDLGEGDTNNSMTTTGGGRGPEAEVDWLLLLMEGDNHHQPATSCEMDRDLWAKLPLDFLDRVLVRLPLVSHLRFQSVCKQWRATLSAPAFLRSRAALAAAAPTSSSSAPSSSASPPICLCRIESGCPKEKARPSALPSPALCKSFKLDLSFLPRKLYYPRFYDKGLLCFRSEPSAAEDVVSLCVCNPVTKTWTELPEFTSSRAHQLRMAVVLDNASSGEVPQVVVLHGEVADHAEFGRNQSVWTIRTCSASSPAQQGTGSTWEWTVRRADPPCPLVRRSTFAMCRGRLFVLVYGVHLLLYAVDGRLLGRVDVTNPCMHYAAHRLLEHRGQVLLCGHYRLPQQQQQQQRELTVRIWRLDQAKMVFQQVSALPERQVRELLQGWDVADAGVELLDCRALADGSVCLHLEVYNLLTGVVRSWVLAFHAAHLTWRLAPMDYLQNKSLTLFEPKLDLFL